MRRSSSTTILTGRAASTNKTHRTRYAQQTISTTFHHPHTQKQPLPSGIIQPDLALLLSLSLYAGVLISACLLEPRTVRIIVAWSAALTLLYTPLLKRMTGVKNMVVAAIIAASPLSGALAAGAVCAEGNVCCTSFTDNRHPTRCRRWEPHARGRFSACCIAKC